MTATSLRQAGRRRDDVSAALVRGAMNGWVEALSVGPPVSFGGLTMMPLLAPAAIDPGWLLMDEALADGVVEVSEISRAGSVPVLRVSNSGMREVLLLDGEELVGGKQNRVLNTTVLVGARSTTDIPVSCVEQGRWQYRGRRFASSGNSLYAQARWAKLAAVSASLREGVGHVSNQVGIWGDVNWRAARMGVNSRVMADAFTASERDLQTYQRALRAGQDQVGALLYGGDSWWGMETLASANLFARAWPRILSGYVMDALWRRPAGEPNEPSTRRLDAVLQASVDVFTAVGAGADCRLQGDGLVGAALVVDEIVAHCTVFPC